MRRFGIFSLLALLAAIGCATGLTSLTLTDDLTVGDDLTVTDDATITDDLTVTGAQTVGETLGVTGNTTMTGSLAVAGGQLEPTATKTAYHTGTVADCGETVDVATDGMGIVLPAVATANRGCCITLRNTGADGAAFVGFSVNASDAVFGQVANAAADGTASGSDDQAWTNTKATANKGDWSTVCSDGSTGWYVKGGIGVWAAQAQ